MLKRIYVHNYRSLINFEFRPDTVNLLLGPNGSGKSSIFEVLAGLQDLIAWDKGVSQSFVTDTLTRGGNDRLQRFEIDVQDARGLFQYVLEIEHDREKGAGRIRNEELTLEGKPLYQRTAREVQVYRDDHALKNSFPFTTERSFLASTDPNPFNTNMTWFRTFMANIWVLYLDPRRIAPMSMREEGFLERTGANFASWYRYVIQEQPDAIEHIRESLKEIMPGFRSLKAGAAGRGRVLSASFAWEGRDDLYELDINQLSDGQRALILLYSLLHTMASWASVVCIDEPDNYVALPEIRPWLERVCSVSQETGGQIMVISHHPEIINYLAADHAWRLSRPSGGPTRIRSLDVDLEQGLTAAQWIVGRYDEDS